MAGPREKYGGWHWTAEDDELRRHLRAVLVEERAATVRGKKTAVVWASMCFTEKGVGLAWAKPANRAAAYNGFNTRCGNKVPLVYRASGQAHFSAGFWRIRTGVHRPVRK